MKIEKNEALEIWKNEKGDKEYAYDFAGRKIKRSDYQVFNQVGWVIGFMRPIELGGTNFDGNIIIMHHTTYEEKGMNYPRFQTLNKFFVVKYDETLDFYYIEKEPNDDYDESGLI